MGKEPTGVEPLFRLEILALRKAAALGEVSVAPPLSIRVICIFTLSFMLVVAIILAFGSYTSTKIVHGELVPASGELSVYSPEAGVISASPLKDGDKVTKGQVLFVINVDVDNKASSTYSTMIVRLEEKKMRLEQQKKDLLRHFLEQVKDAHKKIALARASVEKLSEQISNESEKRGNAKKIWIVAESLHGKGYVSTIELTRYKGTYLDADSQVFSLQNQKLQMQQNLASVETDLQKLKMEQESQDTQLQNQIADLDNEITQNQSRSRVVVRANKSGVVSGLAAGEGYRVSQGQRLLSVVPRDGRRGKLVAELWLPTSDAGMMHAGKVVTLDYPAYPRETFGAQKGTLSSISYDSMSPDEVRQLRGVVLTTSSYQMVVQLDSQVIDSHGNKYSLRSGMEVQARVQVEKRRLYQWLFGSFYTLKNQLSGG